MSDETAAADQVLISDRTKWTLAVLSLLLLGYSAVIEGQVLLGVLVVLFLWTLPLAFLLVRALFRFVAAVEDLAEGVHRLADARESD